MENRGARHGTSRLLSRLMSNSPGAGRSRPSNILPLSYLRGFGTLATKNPGLFIRGLIKTTSGDPADERVLACWIGRISWDWADTE